MITDIIKEIKKRKKSFLIDLSELKKVEKTLSDVDYLKFLELTNGGGILNQSIIFYGVLPNELENEIFYNNFLFQKFYGELISDIFLFAEDSFGNQFGFLKDGKIIFINIETALIEFTFDNFNDFAIKIFENLDYFSGFSVMKKWIDRFGVIEGTKRLCPKKPFVLGGGFEIDNFYSLDKKELFDFYSYIAKQIKDLPDGVQIEFKIE